MTLGDSINLREPSIQKYVGKWISIDFSGKAYAGRLAEIGEHDGSLILQPCLKAIHLSHNLPAIYKLTAEPTTLIPVQMPFAVTPTSEEELVYLIQETNRDVALAMKKREEELQKYDLEHKIQETRLKQLYLPFPE